MFTTSKKRPHGQRMAAIVVMVWLGLLMGFNAGFPWPH